MGGVGESYTCENCGGTFRKAWSDEEAQAESESLFPPQDLKRRDGRPGVGDNGAACLRPSL